MFRKGAFFLEGEKTITVFQDIWLISNDFDATKTTRGHVGVKYQRAEYVTVSGGQCLQEQRSVLNTESEFVHVTNKA